MDPKVVYWTAALANMCLIAWFAAGGVRQIRRGEVARHRRSMRICVALVGAFLLSYVFKLALLGREDLAVWSELFRNTLRFHELCVLIMLVGGGVALQRAGRMKNTRNVTRDESDATAPAATVRLHRRAGWTGIAALVLGVLSATVVLVGMYQRI